MDTHTNARDNINQQQAASKDSFEQTYEWLLSEFPDIFNERNPRPLKIGITKDLIAYITEKPQPGLSNTKLRLAVVHFTRKRHYIRALREGVPRLDLQGNEVGEVTAEESESAYQKLKRSKSKRHAQRGSHGNSRGANTFRRQATPTKQATIKVKKRSFSVGSISKSFTKKISLKKDVSVT